MLRISTRLHNLILAVGDGWRHLRRDVKARAPYVRRREYRNLQRKLAALAEALHRGVLPATQAPIAVRKPVPALSGRVCLFVTHAPERELKTHVIHHVEHLLRAGLQVVLVVNADVPRDEVVLDPDLEAKLSGVFVRANHGFDFAAWCHVLSMCDRTRWDALYLVNDSIVGPVDRGAFDAMMARIASSDADIVGLTENPVPLPHLQSYFLVFKQRALHSPQFDDMVRHMLSFEDKAQVIEVYELRLTESFRAAGFRAEALFQRLNDGRPVGGDMQRLWKALIESGFPYAKTRVLQLNDDPSLTKLRAAARVDSQV